MHVLDVLFYVALPIVTIFICFISWKVNKETPSESRTSQTSVPLYAVSLSDNAETTKTSEKKQQQLQHIAEFNAEVVQTFLRKNAEYSTYSVLSNFEQAARFMHCREEQYLWMLVMKHILALQESILTNKELTVSTRRERIGDIIIYMYLLDLILAEKGAN